MSIGRTTDPDTLNDILESRETYGTPRKRDYSNEVAQLPASGCIYCRPVQGQPGRCRARWRYLVERGDAVDRGLDQPIRDDIRLHADRPAGRLSPADLHAQQRATLRRPSYYWVGP